MTDETKRKISLSKLKYKRKYCQEVLQYFYNAVNKRGRNGMLENVPSYAHFALQIGVSVRSIQNWRKEFPDFDEACEMAEAILIAALDSDSVTFKAHANYVKFLLSSRYGLKERVAVSQEGELVITPELAELIRRRGERDKS